MGLAEAVLEIADELDDAAKSFDHNYAEVCWGITARLRTAVKAAAPSPRSIDSTPTIPTDGGNRFIGVPPHVAYENHLKEIEKKAKEVALKRELRDKEDLGLSCLRETQGNRLATFIGGPLDGESMSIPSTVPVGHRTYSIDSSGTCTYKLMEDGNFHLVDPKP